MHRRSILVVSAVAGLALAGCAGMEDFASKYQVERHSVQSFEMSAPRLRGDAAFAALSTVFVERGFDIKVSNKESGIVTTEYKKFASVGSEPPFDYYLQIRATVRDAGGGKTVIRLTPLVKEQNRLNSAAFTERELYYHVGQPEGIRAADKNGWVNIGHVTFMNIVGDISQRAGVQTADVVKNTTTVRFNALAGQPRS